jgi:hypothetical protein
MTQKIKHLKALINQRFDALEAAIKLIEINQRQLNRRLDAIEDKFETTTRNAHDVEKYLND